MNEPIRSYRFPFGVDTKRGRWAEEESYEDHVTQMIKQVLLTNPGERMNRPDFGCGLRRMIFAPNQESSASMAEVTVREALDTWLGSVIELDNVVVENRENVLEVQIVYTLRARPGQKETVLEVSKS